MQYRHRGKTKRLPIGCYGVLTVDQARLKARALLGAVAEGRDPIAEREAEAAEAQAAEMLRAQEAIRAAAGEKWPVPLQNDLARSLHNRGNARREAGDLAGALADYDAAIALREAIRAALGEERPIPLQNDLARSLQNRAVARAQAGDTAGAAADREAASRILKQS